MLYTLLIVLLILALIGALPAWGYSSGFGYYPAGGIDLVRGVAVLLVLIGRI